MVHWKKGMQPVDFSKLYEGVMLEDEEGDIRPRSTPYFKAKLIAPGTWQVLSDGDYSYLLEGDDELLLIDSGQGVGNIRAFCQSLVPEKPLWRMVLTHSHLDHLVNNYLFDAVYMSRESYDTLPLDAYELFGVPADYPVVFLRDGDVIDLAGRPLEVLHVWEHNVGSIQLLDRKTRILFCGDELNANFFDSSVSVEWSYRNVCRWQSLRGTYDTLAAGNGVCSAEYVDRYERALRYILEGHAGEGVQHYRPHSVTDRVPSVAEKDGVRVAARRTPDWESPLFAVGGKTIRQIMVEKGMQEDLALNDGRAHFCFIRKLNEDGAFDRELVHDGVHVCYYLNRIWGCEKSNWGK